MHVTVILFTLVSTFCELCGQVGSAGLSHAVEKAMSLAAD